MRLRAEVLRQVDRDRFVADNASLTTSRMGIPTYEFKSGTLTFDDEQIPAINPFTGQPEFDAANQPIINHEQLVTGQNNIIQIEGVPVFYWPFFAADLERPPLYVQSLTYRHDNVFGNQILLNLNPYQIFGIRNKPQGTDWTVSLDYLSDRGFGGGTKFDYDRHGFFDWPGRYHGFVDAWYIDDHGIDNLGLDRRDITFPNAFRGRTLFRHEQDLPDDWQARLEVGQITDRNFLQEYYQQEWEEQKDQVTRFNLRHRGDNTSFEVSASGLVDPFFTQTQNLPRLDHYWLGQPLLDDTLTWYEHTNVGYLRQDQLTQPTDPTDFSQFHFLPYDVTGKGERLATRQEIDWPFQVGAVKVVPYALGELADWGNDLNGDNLQRAYGQAGIRATLPVWSVDPTIESELWNVHGMAHKMVFDAEFSYTDANKNLDQLVIYDAIDDNNIQAMRRRLDFEIYDDPTVAPTPFQVPLQVRRTVLRRPPRHYGLGHRPDRNCRRFDRRPLRSRSALANQARHARPAAHYRLDHARHRYGAVPQAGAKLRPGGRHVRLRFPLVRRRSADAAFLRRLRFGSRFWSTSGRRGAALANSSRRFWKRRCVPPTAKSSWSR